MKKEQGGKKLKGAGSEWVNRERIKEHRPPLTEAQYPAIQYGAHASE